MAGGTLPAADFSTIVLMNQPEPQPPRSTDPPARPTPSRSVWTIDLAHLLARFRVRVTMLTVTIGADHSYAHEAFYAPQWGSDAARVQRLFDLAPAAGIAVAQRRCGPGGLGGALVIEQERPCSALEGGE